MHTTQNKYQRLLEISKKHNLSHLGSCLSALLILDHIYSKKHETEPCILSSGHAGLALYVVLESNGLGNAEELFEKHGVHPNKDEHIDCSTGSLGLGITIACGMAFADRSKAVYCLCSDGETAEGAFWEVLRIKDTYNLDNLKVYVNANGYSAYDAVHTKTLEKRIHAFCEDVTVVYSYERNLPPFLRGLDAHYHVMTDEEFAQGMDFYA